jgi:low temperature requirement protein LtrA
MGGVVVLALGLPEMFASLDGGDTLDNGVMVAGYVVMRVSMLAVWFRVYVEDEERRGTAKTYLVTITISQAGWCLLALADLRVGLTFAVMTLPLLAELSGPVVAERRYGGTPWHPHHIAERYGLLTIITLGEGVIGTVAAMSYFVHLPEGGWSNDAKLVLAAGIGLTFGMWWVYFAIPWAEVLHHHRERSFIWGYGHILLFASIAASGAGLHVAEYYLEDKYVIGEVGTVLSVAVPVGVFTLVIYVMYSVVMHAFDPFHLSLLAGTIGVLVVGVLMAVGGIAMPLCLVVVACAPVVTIVGYEVLGHRHLQDHLERLRASS